MLKERNILCGIQVYNISHHRIIHIHFVWSAGDAFFIISDEINIKKDCSALYPFFLLIVFLSISLSNGSSRNPVEGVISQEVIYRKRKERDGCIHKRAIGWLANNHCLLQFLRTNIREILQIILFPKSLDNSLDLGLWKHMDGASAPSGAGKTATPGACAARNSANVIDLGSAALVGSAARVLGVVQ